MPCIIPSIPCRSAGPGLRISRLCPSIVMFAALAGCGDVSTTAPNLSAATPAESMTNNIKQIGLAMANYEGATAQAASKAQAPAVPRKIVYDATIGLVVDSLNGLEATIGEVVKRHGGFLAGSDLDAQISAQRTATWRVRVPVDRFDDFVRAVGKLGEVRTSHLGSQDVTEEFYDVEARIRNKQEEEKRLLKHLADSTGKLEDILKVEAELTRVRGEIEQMQGRIRFLANRAELSTVTITATEWKDYTPSQPLTLATQVRTTFLGSLGALVAFGESLLLVAIEIVPWLPLIAIALLVAHRLYRASWKGGARPIARPAPGGPGAL